MDDVDVSLDKVAFVGTTDWAALEDAGFFFTTARVTVSHCVSLSWSLQTVYMTVECEREGNARLLVDAESGSLWFSGRHSRPELLGIRAEFNPNKVCADEWGRVREAFTSVPRATRVDTALDYDGVSLDDWTFHRPRCSSAAFVDRSLNQTGVQLGRRGSARYLVVYNKGLELGIEELCMTRYEMRQQVRPDDEPLCGTLFDGVRAYRREVPKSLGLHDAGLVALQLYAPDVLGQADWRTRKRIRELTSGVCGELAPMPELVYADRRDELRTWLAELRDGGTCPTARVYAALSEKGSAAGDAAPNGTAERAEQTGSMCEHTQDLHWQQMSGNVSTEVG